MMKQGLWTLGCAALAASLAACQPAGDGPANETARAAADGTIAAGLADMREHTTFARAVQEAGLRDTLDGPTPYTVFAPTDGAFGRLPDGTADNLLAAEQRERLTALLSYHIVPGFVTTEDLARAVEGAPGGRAELATVGGGNLAVSRSGGNLVVADGAGNEGAIVHGDRVRSNGVVHGIEAVLMPAD